MGHDHHLPVSTPDTVFVDGVWAPSKAGRTAPVLCPTDNQELAQVAHGTPDDVNAAVAAARRALEGPWARFTPAQRGRILLRIAALVERRRHDFARLESLDNGKPIRESSRIDVPLAIDCFEYYGGFTTKIWGDTIPVPGEYLAYTERQRIGVVGAITPFNFPLLMAAWKIAPALACGNTVVIKPSPLTPLTTVLLVEVAQEAGVPPGVLNLVTGDVAVGEAMVSHPGIDKIAFTGSTPVGKRISSEAAATLKRVSLELGGKAPNLVFADADLESAVSGSLFGVFWNQGQICTAGSRILVEDDIHDRFIERFVAQAESIRLGDPLDPATEMGPLVSKAQQQRVASYVEKGKREGAELLAGGEPPGGELA